MSAQPGVPPKAVIVAELRRVHEQSALVRRWLLPIGLLAPVFSVSARGKPGAPATPGPEADRGGERIIRLPGGLIPRETEVITLIAAGPSNGEIAARLVVSEATVTSHVNHLLPKVGARDRAQAVSYA